MSSSLLAPMNMTTGDSARITGDINRLHVPGVNATGALEGTVMDYLWTHGPSTVASIHQHMMEDIDRQVAAGTVEPAARYEMARKYTTILNTLTNLVAKNLVTHSQADGTSRTLYVYAPTMNREQYESHIVGMTMDLLWQYSPRAVEAWLKTKGK